MNETQRLGHLAISYQVGTDFTGNPITVTHYLTADARGKYFGE